MEHSHRAPRFDIYALIHKGLRTFMCNTLVAVGTTNANDGNCVEKTLAQVRELIDLCASHVEHENTFIHAAMEARAPGSSTAIANDHAHHLSAIAHLQALVDSVAQSHGRVRAKALGNLYRTLAVFIGQNMAHMQEEESANNTVLWATHTDDELQAIEAAIHQAIAPAEMAVCLRWMLAGMNLNERIDLLSQIGKTAPSAVFESVMGIARTTLAEPDFTAIHSALAQPMAA